MQRCLPEHGAFQLPCTDALFNDQALVQGGGLLQTRLQLRAIADFADPDGRPEVGGFDKAGKAQGLLDL